MPTSERTQPDEGDPGTPIPPYSCAVLRRRSALDGAAAPLIRVLRDADWNVAMVDQDQLRDPGADRWDVIVIPAARVSEEDLLLAAMAARRPETHVVVVSSDRDPLHISDTLRAGVADYLVTPYPPEECLARMESLAAHARSVRRRQPAPAGQIHAGGDGASLVGRRLSLDPATRTLRDGPVRVALSTREWDILAALLAVGERAATAAELAATVWGVAADEARVISTISRLRRKLALAGVRTIDLQTVRGLGYAARIAC